MKANPHPIPGRLLKGLAVRSRKEVADNMGISESRVRELEERALRKIKIALLERHPEIIKQLHHGQ